MSRIAAMARVVVDVMPKPEILDPQGKAVTGALGRLGYTGLTVRQGKRFEVEIDGEVTEARLAEIRDAAEKLLANTVIETFDVRVADDNPADDNPADHSPAGDSVGRA
jgi:phosphoribosylformylglycinamidine synthase PurS subunit